MGYRTRTMFPWPLVGRSSLLLASLLLAAGHFPRTGVAAAPPALPLSASEYSVVTLGDSSSGVNVDVFLDLVCIDTKKAWPVIKQVIQTYDRAVQWRFHQFPLPYHTNAFIVAKGAVVAATYGNDTAALSYMDIAFARQIQVSNELTQGMTYKAVEGVVAAWVQEATGLESEVVRRKLQEGGVEEAVRFSFKYATIRSIFGTPMFVINQMLVPGLDGGSDVMDWEEYLAPLLTQMARES